MKLTDHVAKLQEEEWKSGHSEGGGLPDSSGVAFCFDF